MRVDDKRLAPEFNGMFWCELTSLKKWEYCKYCYHDVPVFVFTETEDGCDSPTQELICCWECGSGLRLNEEDEE